MVMKGRILAVDYGSRRVGLAMSDPLGIISQGAGVIENNPSLTGKIAGIIREQDVRKVIVGVPYAPDGGKGSKALEIDQFIASLQMVVNVPVETRDESLTTVEAQRILREGGMKKKQRRRKEHVDEMSARLLLQDYLDTSAD
jgi:putative Holliday junction resolvase